MAFIKHHEHWHGRLYEAPAYLWLAFQSLIRGIGPRGLLKANYDLDQGGAGFVSKFEGQNVIGAHKFPDSILLTADLTLEERCTTLEAFAEKVGYPIILKPDYGFTGRGILKIDTPKDIKENAEVLTLDYQAQAFVSSNVEFGVFFIRYQGEGDVIGINQKHFPTVTGDGVSTLQELVEKHERYNHFWHSYLHHHDLTQVLSSGEEKRLSFIGSHTMGCKFTEDTALRTPALKKAVIELFADNPGFNFGRLDVLADSVETFQAGEFQLIEINAVNALPTNVFDPNISVWQSYRIFFAHMTYLAKIAAEHQSVKMQTHSLRELIDKGVTAQAAVMEQQDRLESFIKVRFPI